jgi:hypothetical protein
MGILPMCGMAILAMSRMGVPPMIFCFFCSSMAQNDYGNGKDTGKMPVILMGKMPMLHR